MKGQARVGLIALGIVLTSTAKAADKQDFAACDGRIHPGKQDDGLRGPASSNPYERLRFGEVSTIDACTRALASPRLLPAQTLRRAHLLRARAAAYLRSGGIDKALADLDRVEVLTANLASDRFYRRSMGASVQLLRAISHLRLGETEKAATLAREAIRARPYSLAVQKAGADILQAIRPLGSVSTPPWQATVRLEPEAAVTALAGEAQVGNFPGVVALRKDMELVWSDKPLMPFALAARTSEASNLLSNIMVVCDTAYARAATGDAAGARRDLAQVRSQIEIARPVAPLAKTAVFATPVMSALEKYIASRTRQVEARIAVAERRYSDAIGALVDFSLPRTAATIELLTALKATLPAQSASAVPDILSLRSEVEKARQENLSGTISAALLAPETHRAVVDYERARPNILGALLGGAATMGVGLLGGIKRTDGFRSIANADGSTTVEFIGNTPSAALVQEMTLLRAAEVSRAAGKAGFVIIDRKDFSRSLNTSRGGIPISSVPTGFKTELIIRFVDNGSKSSRAFDAIAVIDDLGPYYYGGELAGP
jgi:hypothetical protein